MGLWVFRVAYSKAGLVPNRNATSPRKPCSLYEISRFCSQVCWAVAEEQRCAAEEAACSPSFQNDALEAEVWNPQIVLVLD